MSNRRAVISHELGYFYGLHKRYIDDETPAPNPSELSVRDMPQSDLQEGPTLVDRTRLRAFWGQPDTYKRNIPPNNSFVWARGELAITGIAFDYCNPEPPYTCKYLAAFKWRDLAWGEQIHQMGAYGGSYDSQQQRIIWNTTPFYSYGHMADIGLNFYLGGYNMDLGDKYMEDNIYPRDYTSASYVRMCGSPFFPRIPGSPPIGEWGSFRCSNTLYIP